MNTIESGPLLVLSSDSFLAASFVPARRAKLALLVYQRRGEAVLAIDVTPAELSLHTSGNSVGRTVLRRNRENVTVFCPDVEAATHTALGGNCFRLPDAVLPHRLVRLRDLKNGP
jgi:hypothetical protein